MKKVHSILALVMVGAIALFSCNSGPSEEEKAKHLQDSLDSVTKAQEAAAPKVNQDSINNANTAKAAHIADSLKQDSIKNAGKGKKTATPAAPVKPSTKPAKPANSTKANPTPTPAPTPAPAPKTDGGFDKKGAGDGKTGGTGFEKKGTTPAGDAKTGETGGFKKK